LGTGVIAAMWGAGVIALGNRCGSSNSNWGTGVIAVINILKPYTSTTP
jgi:hypothetical protein